MLKRDFNIIKLNGKWYKKNAIEAIMSASANTRTAELSITEDDTEDDSKATLLINFALPKLSLEKMKKKMSDAPVEKF